jgi:NAD(P)-dependent dehydrogenase (short-subunit alcohol dehydrogenase family)
VRVNAVAPGIIKTPMHEPAKHDFLSASFVTGEIVHVDGGETAGVG